MAFLGPTKDRSAPWGTQGPSLGETDPRLGFAIAILACGLGWAVAARVLPPDAVIPTVSTLMLGFAALFGVIAWRREPKDSSNVTYADVAGALTLIGLFAAATIEPEQLVRLVGDDSR